MKNKYPLVKICTLCLRYRKEKIDAVMCAIRPIEGIQGVRSEEKYPRGYCQECAQAHDKQIDDLLNGMLKVFTDIREEQIKFHRQVCKDNGLDYDTWFPQEETKK